MCLKHNRIANKVPLGRSPESVRASTIEKMRMPYIIELYWKWMWSMMRKPGDKRMDNAIACDCFRDPIGVVTMKL